MAVEALNSASITNDNAVPVVFNNQGAGAPSRPVESDDFVTVSAAASVGSVYRFTRVPTNAKVKSLTFESEAQGAGKVQLGVYRTAADGGAVVNVNLFANDIDLTSAVVPTNEVNQAGNYTLDKRSLPLWQAAGLASDPGGFLDIAATVHTTAVTTGTGKMGARVSYNV